MSLADHEDHIRKAYYIAVVVTWSMILYLTGDLHRKSDHAEKESSCENENTSDSNRGCSVHQIESGNKS